MEIEKNENGYTIKVNSDEYDTLREALGYAEEHWRKFGHSFIMAEYEKMHRALDEKKHSYLTDKEVAPTVNCLVCKNCLPPFFRENGKMCKLNECKFEPA